MSLRSDDDINRDLKNVLSQLVEENRQAEKSDDPGIDGMRRFRFGISILILAVFTLVAGAYPLNTDLVNRALFLIFAVVLAAIGAWNIDRSRNN